MRAEEPERERSVGVAGEGDSIHFPVPHVEASAQDLGDEIVGHSQAVLAVDHVLD